MPPKEAGTPAYHDLQDKPSAFRDLIGVAPLLLQREDEARYAALEQRVYDFFQPADVLEEIWVSDHVALQWDILCLRRVKADLVASSLRAGLEKLIGPYIDWKERDELLAGWVKHDPLARERVQHHLDAARLDERVIVAQSVALMLRELEAIENAIARAEVRRNLTLREFERHRELVADRTQQAPRQIEHTGFLGEQ